MYANPQVEKRIFVAAFLYRIDIADTKYTVSISNSITQTRHTRTSYIPLATFRHNWRPTLNKEMDNGIDLFGASAFLVTPDTDHHNSVTTRWMTHLPGGTIEVTPSVTRHGASSVTQHVATSVTHHVTPSVTPHITTSVTSRGMSMSTPKLPKSVLYSPHATDTWSIADSLLQRSNRSRKNVFSNGDRLQFDTSNADGAPASRDVPGCQPASGDGSVQPKNVEIGRGTYSSCLSLVRP